MKADDLAQESVLFTDTRNVSDLRKWVAAEGNFDSLSGRRLHRTMDTLIRGKPIHSHLAERLVNLGNKLKIRGAHNESHDRVAAKVCAAANGTKNDWKEAWVKYEKDFSSHIAENKKPSVHWRDALTGSNSDKHRRTDTRNKAIISLTIRRFAARAKAADEMKKEAFAHAAANEVSGKDRKAVNIARKLQSEADKKIQAEKRAHSKRMKQINESTRAARAAACNPARVDLGKINLAKPPTKAVLAEECRLRGIVDASAEETQTNLVERLSSYHKLRNENPTLIPELSLGGKAKTKWRDGGAVPVRGRTIGTAI